MNRSTCWLAASLLGSLVGMLACDGEPGLGSPCETIEDCGGDLPAWLTFDGTTRTFSGTPGNSDVGTFRVTLTASDGTDSIDDTFDIAVGNSHFNVTNGCVALFMAWKTAGIPAELHVYDQVSGGFGMTPRGLPVDAWTTRLQEWLDARGITAR